MKIKNNKSSFSGIKKAFAALLCLWLLTAVLPLSAFAQTTNSEKVVRVGWFDSAYNQKDDAGRRTGYAYEYQQKLAAYTGWTYEYVEESWPVLFEMLEKGEIDLLSGVSYTEERTEKMLFPSYDMGVEKYYLYITEEQIDDFDGDFSYFNGKKIGVNKGSVQAEMFRDWAETHNIKADLTELSIKETDSVDELLNGNFSGYITLDNYVSTKNIIPVAKIGSSDIYFGVNKSRPELVGELDRALSRIQDENPNYNTELYNKYVQNTGANLFLSSEEKDWLSERTSIRVGYIDNYLAYCDEDKKTGELTGALKDYLDKAYDCLANSRLSFETTSYDTIGDELAALKRGEVDCIFPANFGDYDGEQAGVILTPAITRAALYAAVKSSEKENFADLEEVTVAIVSGDINFESIVKDLYPECQMHECDNIEACIKFVSEGSADCFLISSYRYNSVKRICDKYKLTLLDTGKDMPFSFAVNDGNTELYSILAKTTNIIPDSYVNNTLTKYYSEESKPTLTDIIKDNIFIVIAVAVVIIAMLLLIIVQRKLIVTEKKANETRRVADDLSRRVYVDALTSVRNKAGYNNYIETLDKKIKSGETEETAICMFDCDNLKIINDKFGHEKGDEYLKNASRLICRIFQHSPVFRIGGDEFISILQKEDYENRAKLIEWFEAESKAINKTAKNDWEQVNVSLGMAEYTPQTDSSLEDMAKRADDRMYENKRVRKAGQNVR